MILHLLNLIYSGLTGRCMLFYYHPIRTGGGGECLSTTFSEGASMKINQKYHKKSVFFSQNVFLSNFDVTI